MTPRAHRPAAPPALRVRWGGEGSPWEIEAAPDEWEPLVTDRGMPGKQARERELAEHARIWARSRGFAVGRTVQVVILRQPPRERVARNVAPGSTGSPARRFDHAWRVVLSSRRAVIGTFVTTGISVPYDPDAPDAPERMQERWEAEVARRAAKNGSSN